MRVKYCGLISEFMGNIAPFPGDIATVRIALAVMTLIFGILEGAIGHRKWTVREKESKIETGLS